MKLYFQKVGLLLSSLVLCISTAFADINSDADIIFDWAELTYSELFRQSSKTQFFDEWRYRYYSNTDNYIGINDRGEVAVLGGQFGEEIVFVGTVNEFLGIINETISVNTLNLSGNDTDKFGENAVFTNFREMITLFSGHDRQTNTFSLRAGNFDVAESTNLLPSENGLVMELGFFSTFISITNSIGEVFDYFIGCKDGDYCGAKINEENRTVTFNNFVLNSVERDEIFSPDTISAAPLTLNGVINY